MDLSVVLPILNERDNLQTLFDEIQRALNPLKLDYEVIAVDDGSTDGSRDFLEKICLENPRFRAVFFRVTAGQSAAFDAGFKHSKGDIIVTMDADLQNDPADIPALLSKLNEGYDFVSGWRKNRKDGLLLRTLPSRFANWLIRRTTKSPLHDMGCSLKAYRRNIIHDIKLYGEMHRLIPVLVQSLGGRVIEVVVNHRPRKSGESKQTE